MNAIQRRVFSPVSCLRQHSCDNNNPTPSKFIHPVFYCSSHSLKNHHSTQNPPSHAVKRCPKNFLTHSHSIHLEPHNSNVTFSSRPLFTCVFSAYAKKCQYHDYRRKEFISSSVFFKNFHGLRQSSTSGSDMNTESAFGNLALDILTETEKVDVMAGSIPQSQIENLVEQLQTLSFDHGNVKTLLSSKIWLLKQPEQTVALCRLLLDHGFSKDLTCRVIHRIPLTHQRDLRAMLDRINETISFFRNFGFSEGEIFNLVGKDPSVLILDEALIRQSVEKVKSFFPSNLAKTVIRMSPNILYDDWSLTHAKFDYCVFAMGYIQSDMIRSRVFSHSLRHIQDRHIFLQRAGLFQFVNKKLHPSLNPNPPLKKVLDSSDQSFVRLVDGVTVQDYQVFKRMREIEDLNDGETDLDTDSDENEKE